MADSEFPCSATLRVNLGTGKRACIAKKSLEVDLELDPSSVKRRFEVVDKCVLQVEFCAVDERMLRVALSSFFDMSKVVVESMDEFDCE